MSTRSPHRDALRILHILVTASFPLPPGSSEDAIAIFKGEMKLHALEFWMRNPDYLADELLDLFEITQDERYLKEAEAIFSNDEPDIRRFPMIRYRFGAYERLDDTLSILVSRDLIKITRRNLLGKVLETDYLIMQKSFDLINEISNDFPALKWYRERAQLITEVANGRGGSALKERQYERMEYARTQTGTIIPSVAGRVRERLELLKTNS